MAILAEFLDMVIYAKNLVPSFLRATWTYSTGNSCLKIFENLDMHFEEDSTINMPAKKNPFNSMKDKCFSYAIKVFFFFFFFFLVGGGGGGGWGRGSV